MVAGPGEAPTIKFSVPNDYRGLLRIIQNSSGVALTQETDLTVDMPANGRLEVKSLSFLERRFVPKAFFSDGRPLNAYTQGEKYNGVGFVIMNSPTVEQAFFFVGDFRTFGEYWKKNHWHLYSTDPAESLSVPSQ